MPLYEYRCQHGHVTDLFCKHSDTRTESTPCQHVDANGQSCKSIANYKFATPRSYHKLVELQVKEREQRWSGKAWHEFHCKDCDQVFMEEVNLKEGEQIADGKPCPMRRDSSGKWVDPEAEGVGEDLGEACGGHGDHTGYDANIDRFSERFPYFDRGLGEWVTSKQDRLDKAAAAGLIPVDGDIDLDVMLRKQQDKIAREKAEQDRLDDRLENHPAFRDYRRARDRGLI